MVLSCRPCGGTSGLRATVPTSAVVCRQADRLFHTRILAESTPRGQAAAYAGRPSTPGRRPLSVCRCKSRERIWPRRGESEGHRGTNPPYRPGEQDDPGPPAPQPAWRLPEVRPSGPARIDGAGAAVTRTPTNRRGRPGAVGDGGSGMAPPHPPGKDKPLSRAPGTQSGRGGSSGRPPGRRKRPRAEAASGPRSAPPWPAPGTTAAGWPGRRCPGART